LATTIEVTCECGRTYVLPSEKEGRKLQCRRCGAVRVIRREAEPGTVVPFQAPGLEEPAPPLGSPQIGGTPSGKARTTRVVKGPPAPLRRCPHCGFKDDPTIVICVRCGLDFRTGERPEDSEEIRIKAETHKAELDADAFVGRVEVGARLGFVPLAGLAFGGYALVLSLGGWSRLRDLPSPSRRGLESRLDAARLLAMGTIILWSGVVAWFQFFYVPAQRREVFEARQGECRTNLEALGKAIRGARGDKGRFPAAARSLRDGIDELAGQGTVDRARLVCPLVATSYSIDAQAPALDERTNPEYLIVWDGDPHVDATGNQTWRALRADGRVEEFRSSRDFDKGRARPAIAFQTPGAIDDLPMPSRGAATFEGHRAAIVAFAKEIDARDPELKDRITVEDFRKRVGLAPVDAASLVAGKRDEEELRRLTARLVARLDVSAPDLVRVAAPFERDADFDVRLTLVRGFKRGGAAWLEPAAVLAADAPAPYAERALALVVGEAQEGKDGLTRVLKLARDRRAASSVSIDQPIFVLPASTFKDAVELLDDRDVALEAVAVLSRAGSEVLDVLDPIFRRAKPELRALAFRALRASILWREASLEPYHERLAAEPDRTVKAGALLALAERGDLETTRRALEILRQGGGTDPLVNVCRKVLAGARAKEAVLEVVNELDRPGPARDEVVTELQRPARLFDESVAETLVARAPAFEAEGSHEAAIKLCALRFDEVSHGHLLREATTAAAPGVRELALRLILENGARLSEKLAGEMAAAAAARLPKETDPAARDRLFALLERWEFRSQDGLLALEGIARRAGETAKDRERAVIAIAASTDPRAVTTLADLVDVLKDQPRLVAASELRRVTAAPTGASTSAEWRRLCHKYEAETRQKLKEREDKDLADYRARQKQVETARAKLDRRS
jgi:hypothetical protein